MLAGVPLDVSVRLTIPVVALAVAVVLASSVGQAGASRSATAPIYSLHFRRAGNQPVVGSGDEVFLLRLSGSGTDLGGTLVNTRTGKASRVPPPPACRYTVGQPELGGHELLFSCAVPWSSDFDLELYDLRSRSWRSLPVAPSIQEPCQADLSSGSCAPVGVGNHWVEIVEQCYNCGATFAFQNLTTGGVSPAPKVGRHAVLDLNSRDLTTPLCAPVVVPLGGFAVPEGEFTLLDPRRGLFVERCGSRHARLVARHPAQFSSTASDVVWGLNSQPRLLHGLRLNNMRNFEIRLPASLAVPDQLLLSGKQIYLLSENGWAWATLPREP